MRCCVPGCKNDSRHLSKSQGITFHVFPTETLTRSAWIQTLGRPHWEPRDRSAICSEHFAPDDLYCTTSGLRKVKIGAVPVVGQLVTNEQMDFNINISEVCRMCLSTGHDLVALDKESSLTDTYQHLTGLIMSTPNLPPSVCTFCSRGLLAATKLRARSLRAHSVLTQALYLNTQLTTQSLNQLIIDNNLTSSLVITHNPPDNYNYNFNHENEIPNDTEIEAENGEVEVKNEINDTEIFTSLINNYTETKSPNDCTENDNLKSDKDFSTDDSLPLERKRTKRKVKVKKVVKKKEEVPKIDRRRKPFLNEDLNETLFTITDLTVEEQLAEIEKRQESSNYKNAVFKCAECYKGFLDEDAYNGHMSRHTKQCGDHRCDICKTHFKHPHALRKHITAHHTQRFSCNHCPYVTTHRQTARLHERWHKGTKYQCPHCPDVFDKFTTYMGHVRIKHPSDFVCALCGFCFVSQKGIDLHQKLKHRGDVAEIPSDGPMCDLCGVRFVSAAAHRQHLRVSARHHGGDKETRELNKPKKGRKTTEAREREKRVRDKSDDEKRRYGGPRRPEGPIACEQCGMQLEDSRAYHGHFRRAHPDKNRTNYPSMKSPCMCEVCGRMFQSYALLKDHTWVHTGERPFQCDECPKSFRMRQRLVAHKRVHSDARTSYGCSLCGKHFSTHSNRQRHMFIHTGLKPFKCEMCGKCFKHASEKRAHITYVHLKKPWPKRSRGKRRQGPIPGPQSMAQEGEAGPLWPCDQKMDHMEHMTEKPVYYNLKI